MNTTHTPSAEDMAQSIGRWLDEELQDKTPGRKEPAALRPDADESHKQCDALVRRLREMIQDDTRPQFREYLDITQTDIATLADQGRLGDLHRSAHTAYQELTALAENLWREWTSEGREFLSERRRVAWNVMRSVRALELGEAFITQEPPQLEAQKKKAPKKPHWPDRAKAEKAVRNKVAEICSSITTEACEDERTLMSYTMSSGRVLRYRSFCSPEIQNTADRLTACGIVWAALEDQGVIKPADRTDGATSRMGDINEWTKSETSSFFAAREQSRRDQAA